MTSAFELIVWMLRRYCALIAAAQPQAETASETASLAPIEALPNT